MSGRLLGNALLGEGQAGGVGSAPRFLGPPYYLVNDTFTTDRSAGAVNGTKAEPGPGLRTVTDTNSKLSLSGGAAGLATGGVGAGDPGLYYGGLVRAVGRIVTAQLTPTTNNVQIGWETNTSGSIGHGWRFAGGNTLQGVVNGSNLTLGTWAANAQNIAIVQRASGCFFFLKPNGGGWLLMWVSSSGNQTPLLPALIAESTTAVATCEFIRVPATLWLPAPLASDGFSASGTTDGLGHAEGVAGGLGSGGNGKAWNDPYGYGVWSTSVGIASCGDTTGLGGGDAPYILNAGKADAIVTAPITRAGGTVGVIVRSDASADNYVKAEHNGTNARLIKVVAGTPTTLINTAATYSAGAEIRVIAEGTKFRLYYNNALIGSEQTIADAALQSGTYCGIVSSGSGINSVDNLTVFARGAGGEYAALDNY